MGQYWKPVNLDKKEFMHAHQMDEGLKLLEQAWSTGGVMTALCMLLAPGLNNGPRGGGDPRSGHPLLGHWAGDRIVFVGDYSGDADMPDVPEFGSLFRRVEDDPEYTDISGPALEMVRENS
jgi:hypothetical protein